MAKQTQAAETGITEQGGIKIKLPLSMTLSKELLEDLYITQKKSLGDIAAIFGCTRQNIFYILNANGIARRTKSKARVEAIRQGKFKSRYRLIDVNEDFFSTWSHEMAWGLGLIWTDGCLHEIASGNGGSVILTSVDKELLEKVNRAMKSNTKIYTRKQAYDPTKEIFVLGIYREKLRNDLKRLGLTSKKSSTIKFPEIPDEYLGDFVRGCWDGDGCICLTGGHCCASIVSGSKDFITALVDDLEKIGIGRRTIYVSEAQDELEIMGIPCKASESYYISMWSIDDLRILWNLMYKGVNLSICLERKRSKLEQ